MNIADLKKRRFLDEALQGDHVLIHVDSRNMDVKVPVSFLNNPRLTLKISRLFNYPPELKEEGVFVPLKFFGVYEDCFLPWSAVWGVTNDKSETTLWDDTLLQDGMEREPTDQLPSVKPEERRSSLKRIK